METADCGFRDRPWHDSEPCGDRCRGSAYWRLLWSWGPRQQGEVKIEQIEQAWTLAHEYLVKGYQVSFSLALCEAMKEVAGV
jgi:hypothetical protein